MPPVLMPRRGWVTSPEALGSLEEEVVLLAVEGEVVADELGFILLELATREALPDNVDAEEPGPRWVVVGMVPPPSSSSGSSSSGSSSSSWRLVWT
jgi:hypothetical protein